jgi:hypothetical protein
VTPPIGLFVPSWLDLAGWAGALFAGIAFIGLGRLFTLGRATPEAALIAGWGAAAMVLTLWGVATPASLRWPASALAAIGILAHALPGIRLGRAEWRAIARIGVLALPLFAVMASARPSLPDTWLNLLPNAAYIYDHGFFPADARPVAHSFIAGAPYNLQLAALIASLVTPGFPPGAMIALNLILQLAGALLLARLAGVNDDEAPSWSMAALGILLATALNPGFVPRYHLSSYSEPSVTVTVAFAGWFAARALDRVNSGRDARLDWWLLALTLGALVNIKQESVMLVVGVLVAAGGLAIAARAGKAPALTALMLAAVPAALLYVAWRWYVLTHFELGELKNLPVAEWHIGEIPLILWNMARQAGSRIFLFLCLAAVAAVVVWRLKTRELDLATRVAAMLAGVALVYNAALLFAYVAHFEGEMGIGAHSYFRYNTHLGLLLMAAFVLLVRRWNWSKLGGHWHRAIPALLVLAVLLDPFPFLRLLRFDLEVPNLRAWRLAQEAAAHIAPDERLLLILPGDNGSVPPTIEGVLRYTPPRRPDVELRVASDFSAALDANDFNRALVSCLPSDIAGVLQGDSALFTRAGSEWRSGPVWRYDPVPPHARWSQVLAPAVFCLGHRGRDG